MGSPNANAQTAQALLHFGCPFSFNSDVSCIEERTAQGVLRTWPQSPDQLHKNDYALLAKISRNSSRSARTCIVVAGIGGLGTLAACYFLTDRILQIQQKFRSQSFASVLHVDRTLGYMSVTEVETRVLPSS